MRITMLLVVLEMRGKGMMMLITIPFLMTFFPPVELTPFFF